MNPKKTFPQIGLYIATALFLIGFMIFYVGIEGNSMFIKIGLSILAPFFILLAYINVKAKKNDQKRRLIKEEIINTTIKTMVNLQKVEIKSSKWIEKIVPDHSFEAKLLNLNDLGGNDLVIKKSTNLVSLKIPYKRSMIAYDIEIEMDVTSLKLHFELQKEAEFYYDPKNPKVKYLNLHFLKEKE
jgi:hypothetical protein